MEVTAMHIYIITGALFSLLIFAKVVKALENAPRDELGPFFRALFWFTVVFIVGILSALWPLVLLGEINSAFKEGSNADQQNIIDLKTKRDVQQRDKDDNSK